MPDRLPFDTLASMVDMLRCPWCAAGMEEALVCLGDLHQLHTEGQNGLRWAERDKDGQAGVAQVRALCPNCGRPSIAAFPIIKRHPATRLMAVRTAADLAWASHAVARLGQT